MSLYTQAEQDRLVAYMQRHVGIEEAASIEQIARATDLSPRIAQILLFDRDGEDYLLGGGAQHGYFACERANEAEGLTVRLRGQHRRLRERDERRQAYALEHFGGSGGRDRRDAFKIGSNGR